MNKWLDDENKEDETFWNQEALKEEENDENYEEGEVVDVFDSDFDDDEPEPDEEVENEADDRFDFPKIMKLYVFEGALGAGSKIKMVIELLEGIHFVSSVEAISLGAQAGSSHGHGNDGDDTLIKAWEKVYGVNITNAVKAETYSPEELANQITTESKSVNRIGFIGLGAMGFGMATHLLRSNFCVIAYDVYEPMLSRFANEGGLIGSSPAEVSKVC